VNLRLLCLVGSFLILSISSACRSRTNNASLSEYTQTSEKFSIDILYRAINKNFPSKNEIQISELMASKSFPSTFRSNYVMVYKSDSLQEASLEKPRVISFSGKDGFVFALTDPEFNGGDTIEIMQLNNKSKRLELFHLMFPLKRNPSGVFAPPVKNPSECLECHKGAKGTIKPLWDEYPDWPGVYASFEGGLIKPDVNTTNESIDKIVPHASSTDDKHRNIKIESKNLFSAVIPMLTDKTGLARYNFFTPPREITSGGQIYVIPGVEQFTAVIQSMYFDEIISSIVADYGKQELKSEVVNLINWKPSKRLLGYFLGSGDMRKNGPTLRNRDSFNDAFYETNFGMADATITIQAAMRLGLTFSRPLALFEEFNRQGAYTYTQGISPEVYSAVEPYSLYSSEFGRRRFQAESPSGSKFCSNGSNLLKTSAVGRWKGNKPGTGCSLEMLLKDGWSNFIGKDYDSKEANRIKKSCSKDYDVEVYNDSSLQCWVDVVCCVEKWW